MRFAIQIEPQYGFTFDDVTQVVSLAEQYGYHALWTSDHLLWDTRSRRRSGLEAWTLLTALAPLTTHLRLGTLVTCVSFRHPSLLAKTVASLDIISHGRVDCGLGAGWNAFECQAYGIPFPPINTRMAQLRETAHILKRLWTEEQVTWHGQHYTLEAAPGMPKPLQPPLPLWIGGQGEHTLLRIVAEAADGWNMVAGKTVAEVQHKREVLWRHCEAVGRDPTTLDTSLFVLTYVYDTAQEFTHCRADQERLLGPDSLANFDHARILGLAGSAAQVTETLRHYVALGFDYVIALFPYQRERDLLQRYAAEVWPHLS